MSEPAVLPPQASLRHNLRIYSWLKVFTKRVYLPLTTIYLVSVGHLSISQIGFLVTVAAVCALAADIPTGYFADRVARKTSLIVGALLLALGALLYILFPNFAGAICAVSAESLGFSFISGAGEALMHDTMVELGQVDNYAKMMGRAQSYGLIGNIILVGLVPMTYGINKRLPFLLGGLAALVLAGLAFSLTEPLREKTGPKSTIIGGLVKSLRTFITLRTFWIFLAIGLLSAFYTVYAQYINLVYKNLGITVSLIGLVYSASSIVGAIGGWYIQYLKRLPFLGYAIFDVAMATSTMILIGLTRNLWVAIIMGLLNLGFWRLRNIIYQDNLLRQLGDHSNKATLVSALSFFDDINETWLPVLFVGATTSLGFYKGFVALGIGAFFVLGSLFALAVYLLQSHRTKTGPAEVTYV